jgi:hypothetical protein
MENYTWTVIQRVFDGLCRALYLDPLVRDQGSKIKFSSFVKLPGASRTARVRGAKSKVLLRTYLGTSARDRASIPMAQGGLSRCKICLNENRLF